MQGVSGLVKSWASENFQPLITFGRLKGRGRIGKKNGISQMTQNSNKLSATKATLRNTYSSAPIAWVPGLEYKVLQLLVQYLPQHNFAIFLCAHYNDNPPNIQKKYDSCMQTFSLHHALRCSSRGIVIVRHNEICDKITHLSR